MFRVSFVRAESRTARRVALLKVQHAVHASVSSRCSAPLRIAGCFHIAGAPAGTREQRLELEGRGRERRPRPVGAVVSRDGLPTHRPGISPERLRVGHRCPWISRPCARRRRTSGSRRGDVAAGAPGGGRALRLQSSFASPSQLGRQRRLRGTGRMSSWASACVAFLVSLPSPCRWCWCLPFPACLPPPLSLLFFPFLLIRPARRGCLCWGVSVGRRDVRTPLSPPLALRRPRSTPTPASRGYDATSRGDRDMLGKLVRSRPLPHAESGVTPGDDDVAALLRVPLRCPLTCRRKRATVRCRVAAADGVADPTLREVSDRRDRGRMNAASLIAREWSRRRMHVEAG